MKKILFCSTAFTISSIIFMLTAIFLIIYKRKNKTNESKIYIYLSIVTLITSIVELIMSITIKNIDTVSTLNQIICRLYIFLCFNWSSFFCYYIFSSNEEKPSKALLVFNAVVFILSTAFSIMVPLKFEIERVYTIVGISAYAIHIYSLLMSLFEIFLLTFNKIAVKNLSKLPLYVGVIAYIGLVSYQFITGNFINILSFMLTLIVIDFFFSTESQDDKLIVDYENNKKLSEEVNKEKDKFLSNMSKEIRTPMSNIMGISDLILINQDTITLEDVKSSGKEINNESIKLLDTINNILDLARYEAKKEEVIESEYSFEKLIFDIDDYIISKEIQVEYLFGAELPESLTGDITKLKKIIELIIEKQKRNFNISKLEIKYAHEGIKDGSLNGFIEIGVVYDGKYEDSELDGINLEDSIINYCSELINAKVEENNESEIKKVFSIRFSHKVNDQRKLTNDIRKKLEQKNNTSYEEVFDYSNNRILVVDDSQININIVKRLFKKYNFTLDEAISGEKCIELCKNNKYNLILLDDMMPGMSGVETLAKLKDMGIDSPTIALTANAYDGLKEKYISQGFSDYLSKPIDPIKMDKILREFLNKEGEDSNAL